MATGGTQEFFKQAERLARFAALAPQ